MANKPNNPGLWSRAKSMAKKKFDVYPSAYANSFAAKWYKSKGGTWRKAQMGMEVTSEDPNLASMGQGGTNNPGFRSLPTYVQAKIKANMEAGGYAPQTAAGQSILQEAMMMSKMQSGGKMPADIARARFMAAAEGNKEQATETAAKYGYKMQSGAQVPANMRAQIAEGQAVIAQQNSPQGQAAKEREKQRQALVKQEKINAMKARIADSKKVQDMSFAEQFTAANIARATQATGDKLRVFGPESPLVTSGLADIDPNSFIDNYLNPAKFTGDMVSNLGRGIEESSRTGNYSGVGSAIATPLVAGATMGLMGPALHRAQAAAIKGATSKVSNQAISTAMSNPAMTGAIGATAGLVGRGISRGVKTGVTAAEHDAVHRAISPFNVSQYKKGGKMKYMVLGAKAVDNYMADNKDPRFEQYYNQQIQGLNQSGVKQQDLPTRNDVYSYYKSSNPDAATDQTGRLIFNNPSAKPMMSSNTYTQAVDPTTGKVAMQTSNLNKQIFDRDVQKFGAGGGMGLKDSYYMKKGGQFPERYKKMGFSGVDKPKQTTSGGKSHAVVTKVDGNYKLIRFGQAGVSGSPDGSARNKAFKARHAKNIAKGKSSAAYWANKTKW